MKVKSYWPAIVDNSEWHTHAIPIDNLHIIKMRKSYNGEGFSLYIGKCMVYYGGISEKETIAYAHKLESEVFESLRNLSNELLEGK